MASIATLLFFDLQSTCRLPIYRLVKKHIHLANVLQQEIHVIPHVVARVVNIPIATVLCLVSVKGKYMCGRHTASTTISLGRGQTLTNGGWSTLESIILQVIFFIDRELLMDLEQQTF